MENIIDRAIIFATNAHSGTMRKGTTIPYIVHPMEAGAIAAGLTDDYEVIAAAILHDTLEDTNTTFSSLKEAFGERVADLVAFESEDKQPERPANATWRERKQATIDSLLTAEQEEMIIAFSDKLANLRAIYRDYLNLGNELWNRFNQKDTKEHLWYYGSFLNTCKCLEPTAAYKEFKKLYEELSTMV